MDAEVTVAPKSKLHAGLRAPWKKGQSGNPAGKQRGYTRGDVEREIHRVLTAQKGKATAQDVAQALCEVACDKDHPRWFDAVAMLLERVNGPVARGADGARAQPSILISLETTPGQSARVATLMHTDKPTTGVVVHEDV